jgi:MFS family permease
MPVLRLADRVGRRRMLLVSVLAFTVATAATSVAWGLAAFVVFQMVARLFLATEESLSGIVISEEVRSARRGAGLTLLGIIAMSGFGLVAAMLLVVPHTPLEWRILYLAALPPLVLVAWLRRNLRETEAFAVAREEDRVQPSFWPHVDAANRSRLWRITVVLGTHGLLGTPSLGLLVVGLLDDTWSTRASIYALAAVMLAGLWAVRALPETVGADVIRADAPRLG